MLLRTQLLNKQAAATPRAGAESPAPTLPRAGLHTYPILSQLWIVRLSSLLSVFPLLQPHVPSSPFFPLTYSMLPLLEQIVGELCVQCKGSGQNHLKEASHLDGFWDI